MYHALAQDKLSTVALVLVSAFFYAFLSHSSAQSQDITPPTLTAFSFTPTTINTAAGNAIVTASWSATDDLSGVSFVSAAFSSSLGLQAHTAVAYPSPAPSVSATGAVTFPQFSETGTWTVVFVSVVDAVGNSRTYSTAELARLGFPTELVVVGQAEDITPPAITVFAIPAILWPPNGKMVPVTISGTIKDAESGVNASTAAYAVKDEYGLIQPRGHITTLDAAGHYAFMIQLQASRNGNDRDGRQYTITVRAVDDEGYEGSGTAIVTVPHDLGQGQSSAAR